jgi:hypothetical protein
MTTSRSTGSPSKVRAGLAALTALLVAAWILLLPSVAEARRRVVVLDFDGEKGDEFREDLEKFLKKNHSVVPRKKWDSTAEDLEATKVNERNIKKVARKLSVDGVITGKIEKRSSRYYVRVQLRDGTSGKSVSTIELVERGPKFSADGKGTLTDELLTAIDELESAGDDDDGDDDGGGFGRGKMAKGKGAELTGDDDDDDGEDGDEDAGDDDDGDDRAAQKAAKAKAAKAAKDKAAKAKAAKAAKDKAAKAKAARDDEDEDGDEDAGDDEDGDVEGDDRVADADDDDEGELDGDVEDGGEDEDDGVMDPRTRPLDLAAGLSFTARRLSFTTNLTSNQPLGYKSNPVAGISVAADLFPLAFNRSNRSITRNVGLTFAIDRVIKIDSRIAQGGMTYALPTTEQHLGFGVIYRHLVGAKLTVNASIRYNKRKFVIDRSPAAMPDDVDIPNVSYTYVDPGLGLRYVLGPKMALGADARFMLITDTGAMQSADQYGGATVTGVDLEGRFDYQIGNKLLVRASAGLDRIKFSFKGNGMLSNNRDGDSTTTDVSAASDLYFGGSLTGVYLF